MGRSPKNAKEQWQISWAKQQCHCLESSPSSRPLGTSSRALYRSYTPTSLPWTCWWSPDKSDGKDELIALVLEFWLKHLEISRARPPDPPSNFFGGTFFFGSTVFSLDLWTNAFWAWPIFETKSSGRSSRFESTGSSPSVATVRNSVLRLHQQVHLIAVRGRLCFHGSLFLIRIWTTQDQIMVQAQQEDLWNLQWVIFCVHVFSFSMFLLLHNMTSQYEKHIGVHNSICINGQNPSSRTNIVLVTSHVTACSLLDKFWSSMPAVPKKRCLVWFSSKPWSRFCFAKLSTFHSLITTRLERRFLFGFMYSESFRNIKHTTPGGLTGESNTPDPTPRRSLFFFRRDSLEFLHPILEVGEHEGLEVGQRISLVTTCSNITQKEQYYWTSEFEWYTVLVYCFGQAFYPSQHVSCSTSCYKLDILLQNGLWQHLTSMLPCRVVKVSRQFSCSLPQHF